LQESRGCPEFNSSQRCEALYANQPAKSRLACNPDFQLKLIGQASNKDGTEAPQRDTKVMIESEGESEESDQG